METFPFTVPDTYFIRHSASPFMTAGRQRSRGVLVAGQDIYGVTVDFLRLSSVRFWYGRFGSTPLQKRGIRRF